MKSSLVLSLALSFAGWANAWTFHWYDAQNHSHVETGIGETNCTVINMIRGRQYSWDPESGPYCINMYRYDNCTTDRNGWSCPQWGPRNLGQDFVRAFQVTRMADPGATSTTSSSSTATSSSSTSILAPVTVTAEPTETAETVPEGSGTISGGAIGGIVVGSLAAGAAIAVIGLLVWRRKRGKPVDPHSAKEYGPSDDKYPASGGPPMKERSQELDSHPTSPVAPPSFGAISPHGYAPGEHPPEKGNLFSEKYGGARPPIPELPENTQIAELDSDFQKQNDGH